MNPLITLSDLILINDLSNRNYSGNSMSSKAGLAEIKQFGDIKGKLKSIANYYKSKYDNTYGIFESSVTGGNPIAMGGQRLKRVWSGISKGTENKQYSAQISFVMSPEKQCLDVGFYFGRASARDLDTKQRRILESQLNELGLILSKEIGESSDLHDIYNSLFDYGFQAFAKEKRLNPEKWMSQIAKDPTHCQITNSIYVNSQGFIDPSTIDLYVSMIISLMNPLPTLLGNDVVRKKKAYRPLTPEQRAKQAERRTIIGEMGEILVMNYEKNQLKELGIERKGYPDHVALRSTTCGYDILSCFSPSEDKFIEVKTTTRLKSDPESAKFYISSGEYNFYAKNKDKYRLYRVFDIEGNPEIEVIDMNKVGFEVDGYIGKINLPLHL